MQLLFKVLQETKVALQETKVEQTETKAELRDTKSKLEPLERERGGESQGHEGDSGGS